MYMHMIKCWANNSTDIQVQKIFTKLFARVVCNSKKLKISSNQMTVNKGVFNKLSYSQ